MAQAIETVPAPLSHGIVGSGARRRQWTERLVHAVLLFCASVSVVTTVGIVVVLMVETLQFFKNVSLAEFLLGTHWSPLIDPPEFGVLPLVCGTAWVAVGAGTFAIPIGLASAIYLSEYSTSRFRDIIKPVLEILAGIPSVVYGYLAVVLISPIVRWLLDALRQTPDSVLPEADVFNAVNAGIVVGIMILPTVVSLSEDVLRSVPRSLREAAYALGSTKFDVTVRVVVPAGLSGIVASFLLGISRAIGETMAVNLAAGLTPKLTWNPFESVQTMTSYIVQVSQGDTPAGGTAYQTIFAVGMGLFLITLVMNILAQWVLSRFREVYE